jgi:hypothetical protein
MEEVPFNDQPKHVNLPGAVAHSLRGGGEALVRDHMLKQVWVGSHT